MDQSTTSQDMTDKFSNTIGENLHGENPENEQQLSKMRQNLSGRLQRWQRPLRITLGAVAVIAAAGYVYWQFAGRSSRFDFSRSFRKGLKPLRKSFKPIRRRVEGYFYV